MQGRQVLRTEAYEEYAAGTKGAAERSRWALIGGLRVYWRAMIRVNRREFQELVREALTELPEEFARAMKNVAVVIEEEPTEEELVSAGLDPEQDDLYGLYLGVPLPERGPDAPVLPDRIAIYRLPILWDCDTRGQVLAEVRTTVIHELGHYFGLPEDELPP